MTWEKISQLESIGFIFSLHRKTVKREYRRNYKQKKKNHDDYLPFDECGITDESGNMDENGIKHENDIVTC